MKTKQIIVCDAIYIDVSCVYDEKIDDVFGYDFYVSPDCDLEAIINDIKSFLIKYNRPLISITHGLKLDYDVSKLWDTEKIEECIKTYEI